MEQAFANTVYDKLEDGTFAGCVSLCTGVVAFGPTLRECEDELRSTLEDWILVGLKLGHMSISQLSDLALNGVEYAEEVAMYCSGCGTELPQGANFCYKCGKPVGRGTEIAKVEWEFCQIEYNFNYGLMKRAIWFSAKAVGPNGVYSAGESPKHESWFGEDWPNGANPKNQEIHRQLVETLIKDGWEFIPELPERGRGWWQWRFRRKVKA